MIKCFVLSSVVSTATALAFWPEQLQADDAQPDTDNTVYYICDDGADFAVRFENSHGDTDAAQAGFNAEKVTLTDARNHSAYPLTRVRSASGEKWSDGEWTYWSRGDEAMIQQGDDIVYANCRVRKE